MAIVTIVASAALVLCASVSADELFSLSLQPNIPDLECAPFQEAPRNIESPAAPFDLPPCNSNHGDPTGAVPHLLLDGEGLRVDWNGAPPVPATVTWLWRRFKWQHPDRGNLDRPAGQATTTTTRLRSHVDPVSGRVAPPPRPYEGAALTLADGTVADVHVAPRRLTQVAAARRRIRRAIGGRAPPNIYVLVLESLSRPAFMRYMPKTREWLRSLHYSKHHHKHAKHDDKHGWSSFVFAGMHTAAEGSTTDNLLPAFGGVPFHRARLEQRRVALVTARGAKQAMAVHPDVPPARWAWNRLKARGYVTMGADDFCGTAGVFFPGSEAAMGFDHAPPLLNACPAGPIHAQQWPSNANTCALGIRNQSASRVGRPFEYVLNYTESFFTDVYRGQGVPLFGYVHLEAGHTHPKFHRNYDGHLAAHLQRVLADRATMLLLLGDHGIAFGFDQKMPLFSLVAPNAMLRDARLDASVLAENQRRLLSSYDIYATLEHLMRMDHGGKDESEEDPWVPWESDWPPGVPRPPLPMVVGGGNDGQEQDEGRACTFRPLSVLARVPAGRTCPGAGIAPAHCGCTRWSATPAAIARTAASLVVGEIARGFPTAQGADRCGIPLRLGKVLDATHLPSLSGPDGGLSEVTFKLRFEVEHWNAAAHGHGPREFFALLLLNDRRFRISTVKQTTRWNSYARCTPSGFSAEFCACHNANDTASATMNSSSDVEMKRKAFAATAAVSREESEWIFHDGKFPTTIPREICENGSCVATGILDDGGALPATGKNLLWRLMPAALALAANHAADHTASVTQ